MATLELVAQFSDASLALSAVVLIRFLPSLLLAPLAGVLADSCNRVNLLIVMALADGVLVACLALVHSAAQTPLLFALLAAQFTAIALQDPARKAIVPVLVPPEQLHLAATLETFSWSLTGALGAAVGGWIASRLGNSTCFLIDAATYVAAAWFANKIPRELGAPDAMDREQAKRKHSRGDGVQLSALNGAARAASVEGGDGDDDLEAAPLLVAPGMGPERRALTQAVLQPTSSGALAQEERPRSGSIDLPRPHGKAPPQVHPPPAGVAAMLAAASGACAEGLRAFVEGWRYLLHRENRDVAALVLIKGCGSATWGAVDILNVK